MNGDTVNYARKALQVLDARKVTTPNPFKNTDLAIGYLNLVVGSFVKDQSPVEAAAAFRKALQPDTPYRNDPLIYHRMGIAILKGEFAQLSAEYNEKYGSKPSSSEQQAMIERINHLGERAIDAYARAYALSDPARSDPSAARPPFPPELRARILEQLTALYKSFHNNSDAGLSELISSVLSKPLP